MEYFLKKNDYIKKNDEKAKNTNINIDEIKKLNKIKSIICSIYLCYYIRLTNENRRNNFENYLKETLLQIANVHCEEKEEKKEGNLFSQIRYEKLREELRVKNFQYFSELLKIEEEFLLYQI